MLFNMLYQQPKFHFLKFTLEYNL